MVVNKLKTSPCADIKESATILSLSRKLITKWKAVAEASGIASSTGSGTPKGASSTSAPRAHSGSASADYTHLVSDLVSHI